MGVGGRLTLRADGQSTVGLKDTPVNLCEQNNEPTSSEEHLCKAVGALLLFLAGGLSAQKPAHQKLHEVCMCLCCFLLC